MMKFMRFLRNWIAGNEIEQLRKRNVLLSTNLQLCKSTSDKLYTQWCTLNDTWLSLKSKYDALLNQQSTASRVVDINDERILTGSKRQDLKSPHSSFTKDELKRIGKNLLTANKRIYLIELYGDTNSMEPGIDDNTIIFFEKYDDEAKKVPLSVQDIVDYKNPSGFYYVHRIIDVREKNNETQYRIKGDNNMLSDGWFTDKVN